MKPESESISTNDQLTSGASELESLADPSGTVVNHLPSQPHSPPNASAAPDFSLSGQSSNDLTSFIDHCLEDSMSAEIEMINSSTHAESTDSVDFHSALSTPSLHPDSDNESVLPANECYANGVFPDKIVSRSPSAEQLQINSLFDDYSKDDSDAKTKQLFMDVNSLLCGGVFKNECEEQKCEQTSCQKSDKTECISCDAVLPDAVDSLTDVTSIAGTCEIVSETVQSVVSGFADSTNDDAVGSQKCDAAFLRECSPCLIEPSFHLDKEPANSPHDITQCVEVMSSECASSELPAGDSTAGNINEKCDLGKVTPKTEDIEPVVSNDSSKNDAYFVTSLAPAVPVSDNKGNNNDMKISEPVDIEWPSLSDGICKKEEDSLKDKSDNCSPFPVITISESTTAVANSVNTASLWNADGIRAGCSFPSKVKGASPMPCMASFSSSSSEGWSCEETFAETWLPDWKLQTNTSVKLERLVLPLNQSLLASSENKGRSSKQLQQLQSGQTSSPSKLAFVQPVLSKMTLEEAPAESKSLTAELTVKAAHFVSNSSSLSAVMKDVPAKQPEQGNCMNTQSLSSLVRNVTTSLPSLDAKQSSTTVALAESKSLTAELPVKVAHSVSKSSSLSAVTEDVPAKQPEQGNRMNTQSLSSFVRNVTSSLPSLDAKQSSTTVASNTIQQKHFNYADYCNDPNFQPVVQLVRLPLEFFRMLQQTSQPVASSSVSITDLPKRFVTLKTYFSCKLVYTVEEEDFRIHSKVCCEGAHPLCRSLSRRGLNPIKLGYNPHQLDGQPH